jgi:hypothetical protein
MNEISRLVVVPPDEVDMLVPSGTMLQVIVAGAPVPDRDPEAVESHGSGSLGLIMKPLAGIPTNTAQENAIADKYPEYRRI